VNFAETERYLLSLGNEVSAMKLGLETIRLLLDYLGKPDDNYLKLQVAGTNGKGSVCAFVDAVLLAAGVKTGLFTSPHLVSIRERVKISGEDIDEDEFARIATLVRETAEMLVERGLLGNIPTFFEQVTAIALIAFADHGAAVVILETGLGGRLDATTAAGAEICGITQIALDHQEYLGDTIEDIAAEKAAIVHPGSQAVIAEQGPEVMSVLLEHCETVGVKPLIAADVSAARGNGRLKFTTDQDEYSVSALSLRGTHQISNAKAAILLAELLQQRFPQIEREHIVAGLETAPHPGRLEMFGNVLLDGAHNVAGARALAEYLDESVDRPVTIIFALMKGKDAREIADILFSRAKNVVLTQPLNSRAMTPNDICDGLSELSLTTNVEIEPSVIQAIRRGRELAGESGTILITGSLYLVGEAREILNN
jgi:dihydrofolate synthase/folylpolyglutamate synthase